MDFSAVLDFCAQIKNEAAAKPLFVEAYRKNRETALYSLILLHSSRLSGFESHYHLEKYEKENE